MRQPPERVAVLGLGTMGSGIAANLLKAGYRVAAFNRTLQRRRGSETLAAGSVGTPFREILDR
jgi:3-hydroxyisobutyrate dehydrogenase-like beta-hydroxyacid dehydrogenase